MPSNATPQDSMRLRNALPTPRAPPKLGRPAEIEEALVRMHSWLRAIIDGWKRSGQLVPLGGEDGNLLLQVDEERVLLVELVPRGGLDESGGDAEGKLERPQPTGDDDAHELTEAIESGGSAVNPSPGEGAVAVGAHRSASHKLGVESSYRKTKLEGEISLELIEYDDALRKSYEQRLQRFFSEKKNQKVGSEKGEQRLALPPPQLTVSIRLHSNCHPPDALYDAYCARRRVMPPTLLYDESRRRACDAV